MKIFMRTPEEFLNQYVCSLEQFCEAKTKKQRNRGSDHARSSEPENSEFHLRFPHFVEDAYESGMVLNDCQRVHSTMPDPELYQRKPTVEELEMLSDQQVTACISMQFRQDHFDNGILINKYIAEGIMLSYMKSLQRRLQASKQPEKISLNDLLRLDPTQIARAKVRFNQTSPQVNPMDLYLQDPELVNTQWLLWRTSKRYFAKGQIAICLLKLTEDTWLLTTVKQITEELNQTNGINYSAAELTEYKKYYGRVIVKFHKSFQAQCVYYNNVLEELEVNQILPDTFDGKDFPGYDNVRISYQELVTIISVNKKDWVAALENQKGVYLIADTHTGKLYIGSATSSTGMLLQRWKNYAANGHGGNQALLGLVEEKGMYYVKQYFQYAILENFNSKVDDQFILNRECWWKETLLTRRFGYNCN